MTAGSRRKRCGKMLAVLFLCLLPFLSACGNRAGDVIILTDKSGQTAAVGGGENPRPDFASGEPQDSDTAGKNSPDEPQDSDTTDKNSPDEPQDSDTADKNSPDGSQDSDAAGKNSPDEPQDSDAAGKNSPDGSQDSDAAGKNSPDEPQDSDAADKNAADSSEKDDPAEEAVYLLNPSTKKIHLPSCSAAKRSKSLTGSTLSLAALLRQGYTVCGICHPEKGAGNDAPADSSAADAKTPTGKTDGYVLNTSSKKIHLPSCSAAAKIKAENRKESSLPLETLLSQGYTACGICHPAG